MQDTLLEKEGDLLPVGQELRQMAGMAIQLSLRGIVRQVLTTTDAAFLGHLGTKQLAGVSLAAMWQGVPSTFVQFSLQAITTLSSQARGAGNKNLAGEWLQTGLAWAIVGTIPVAAIYCCVGPLVGITMSDEETQFYAQEFSRVMAWSLIPQYLYVALASYFACIGVVIPATICTCITMVLNVCFNYYFIYGYGEFEGYGFVGSPMATVTSSWVQLFLFAGYTVFWKKLHRDYWGGWNREAFTWGRFKIFMGLGAPAGASSVVDWASAAIAGAFSGLLGNYVAASQNVLGGVFSVTYSTVSGFATVTQIRIARYLGEGNPIAAKRVLRLGCSILLTGAAITCIMVAIFHDALWRIWTSDDSLVMACDTAVLAFNACVLTAYLRFTLTAIMSALGPREANINLVANNIASWLIYIPLAYVMPIIWGWGISGFWWSDFAGEAFKVVVLSWGVSKVDWAMAAKEARETAAARDEDVAVSEKLEAAAFTSPASYASPVASHAAIASPSAASGGLMTAKAADNYELVMSPTSPSATYVRSPKSKQEVI